MHNSNNFVVCNNTQAAELRGGRGARGSWPPPYFFRADKPMHFCLVAAKNSVISQPYLLLPAFFIASLLSDYSTCFSLLLLQICPCFTNFKLVGVAKNLHTHFTCRWPYCHGPLTFKSFHHLCNKVIYLCYYYLCLTQPPALLIHQ